MRTTFMRLLATAALGLALAACVPMDEKLGGMPTYTPRTTIARTIESLPPPAQPVPIAVYAFTDQTGQHKPNEGFAEYSRAVTQGAAAMLVHALRKAGGGRWFMVIEREGLDQLLKERQIIRAVRDEYRGPDGRPLPEVLDPLLYPGILIMGGITAYESNTVTGGAGARYLGIGGNTEYRRDDVTVDLRVVGVKNGRVHTALSTSKSIYSVLLQSGVFKYLDMNDLLEAEAGFSRNEPAQLAVRQAIEKAVYGMVVEGAMDGLWSFADPAAQARRIAEYRQERYGEVTLAAAPAAADAAPLPAVTRPEGPASERTLEGERQVLDPAAAPGPAERRLGNGAAGRLPSADVNGSLPEAERERLRQ
jgi:curli production assembly/transport component CsgG